MGEWDLIPWATFPGWAALHWVKELNNFPRLQTCVSYVNCTYTSHPKRVSLSLRVSQHRFLFVLRIKELGLNYKSSPDPYFCGLKNGTVTFCWHYRECGLCWWIRDLPLKFQPEVLVLKHQLYFLRFSLWHLSLLHIRLHVLMLVFVWCDLLNTRKRACATFLFKWREKNIFLWNDDNELFITASCAFYFLLLRKQWFVWIFGVVFKWIMI